MRIHLVRTERSDEGTFGFLDVKNTLLRTAEPPWRDNQIMRSSIPFGIYQCSLVRSPRFGWAYQVHDVPGRAHILIHAGNWAGDSTKGFITNTDGCILLGMELGVLEGQKAVVRSGEAVAKLFELTDKEPFTLYVSGLDL